MVAMDPKDYQILHFLFWAEDEFGQEVVYTDGRMEFWNRHTELFQKQDTHLPRLTSLLAAGHVTKYRGTGSPDDCYKLTDAGRKALMDEATAEKLASPDLRFYTFDFSKERCPGCKRVTPLVLYPKAKTDSSVPLVFCTCGYLGTQAGNVLNERDDP